MKHARPDYDVIQDTTAARELADLVLSMGMVTPAGLHARELARRVLGVPSLGGADDTVAVATNGTVRLIPADEPVFLIRGQDAAGGGAVRVWADLTEVQGAQKDILRIARKHAEKMDVWLKKKMPDLPYVPHAA